MGKATEELELKAEAAKAASRRMVYLTTEIKNKALNNIAADLLSKTEQILAANRLDYKAAENTNMSAALLDRLLLTAERLESMAQDVLAVAALPDPVGEKLSDLELRIAELESLVINWRLGHK